MKLFASAWESENNMIRLYVSDVDGTLIQNYAEKIPEELFSLVDRLYEKNIYFAVATGRQWENAADLFAPVADKIYYLGENGCKTVFQGKLLDISILDTGRERELMDDIFHEPDAELWVNGETESYAITRNSAFIRELVEDENAVFKELKDPAELSERLTKIGLLDFHRETVREELLNRYREKYADTFQIMTAGHGWLDFIKKDAGKGEAVRKLMKHLLLSPEEVAVFGDNENDVSMFGCTPHSYAMENSADHVKRQAGHVTSDVVRSISLLSGEGIFS